MTESKAAKAEAVTMLDGSGSSPASTASRAAESKGVEVTLSHHLNVGADGLPAAMDNPPAAHRKPGEKVTFPRGVALSLIHAGLTTVNPHDAGAITAALG